MSPKKGRADVREGGSPGAHEAAAALGDPNSLRAARSRRQGPAAEPESAPREDGPRRVVENSIRAAKPKVARVGVRASGPVESAPPGPTKDRTAAVPKSDSISRNDPPASPQSTAAADSRPVPDHIRRRFVQVGHKYYFTDGARAFTDRGRRLTTPSENTEVIKSLVTIAQTRGWTEISVRGTERFRKEAWFAARMVGLEVRGFRPSEFEQGRLIRALARQNEPPSRENLSAEPGSPERAAEPRREASPAREETPAGHRAERSALLTGKLVEHGRAPYHHDPHERMSYFVKIETRRGDRVIWGVDLERAFTESLTQPQVGDTVGLRAIRQEAVKVKSTERNPDGQVIGEHELATHRNRWVVEKRDFFEARAAAAETLRDSTIDPKQAIKQHPELVGTYLQVRAAELAARRIRDPEDQQKFVARVRSSLAESVARGEPLSPVRLRERSPERAERSSRRPQDREPAPVRG